MDDNELLRMLIGASININAKTILIKDDDKLFGYKHSPLIYAVYKNKIEMAHLLLKAGSDVDVIVKHLLSKKRTNAIEIAIHNKNQELLDLLISYSESKIRKS